jgi:protein-tyrosine phosphatase
VDNGAVSSAPDTRFHVCIVCSGNICRSPIGEQVLRAAIARAGLDDRVRVSSAGIGDWHVGQGANPRTVRVLQAAGYPTDHRARQISRSDLDAVDLVVAADRGHVRELHRMTTDSTKVVLFRAFDPDADDDEVPDPYFGPDSGFDEVLAMTEAAVPGLLDEIVQRLAGSRADGGLVADGRPADAAP